MPTKQNSVLVGFCVRGTARCDGCGDRFPVGGLASRLACPTCGDIREVTADQWGERLAALRRTIILKPGDIQGLYDGGGTILKFGWDQPACPHCTRRLPPPDELENHLAAGAMGCPHCQKPVSLRQAKQLDAAIHPDARFVVGETLGADGALELDRSREPVVITCSHCGGALSIDGAARTVSCSYCAADNYLPDGLWQRLNPVPKAHFIYLVAAVSARAFERAQQNKSGAGGDDANDSDLPPPDTGSDADDPPQEHHLAPPPEPEPPSDSAVEARDPQSSGARRYLPLAIAAGLAIIATFLLAVAL